MRLPGGLVADPDGTRRLRVQARLLRRLTSLASQCRPWARRFTPHTLLTTVRRADARGNLMFDAQIAALCREHGIAAILTNDRDFERFDRLQVRYLDEASDHGDDRKG